PELPPLNSAQFCQKYILRRERAMVPAQGVAALERHRVKQRQVKAKALQLLDQGLSPKEVAQRTDLAEHTVRTYLRQRFRASGMTREIVNHQVVIEGQIYVDEYYLMNDLGVSQPWINRLLQQLPV